MVGRAKLYLGSFFLGVMTLYYCPNFMYIRAEGMGRPAEVQQHFRYKEERKSPE